MSTNQTLENLKELKALLDSGALTQEEFDTEKKKLLDRGNQETTADNRVTETTAASNSSWENNLKEFTNNSELDMKAQQWFAKGAGKYLALILLAIAILATLFVEHRIAMIIDVVAIAVMMGSAMLKSKGIVSKIILTLLLLLPVATAIIVYSKSLIYSIVYDLYVYSGGETPAFYAPFLASSAFILAFCLFCPRSISKAQRFICSVALFTIGNPTAYVFFAIENVSINGWKEYTYLDPAKWMFLFATLIALIICYIAFSGKDLKKNSQKFLQPSKILDYTT